MPDKQDILNGLQAVANSYTWFARIWHTLFYMLIIVLIAQWEPSNRLLAALVCLPLVSVAVLAWISGNPFNGLTFSALALFIAISWFRLSGLPVSLSPLPYVIAGILMIAFGLIYPHFIEANSVFRFLSDTPFGLIPCPTLSVLIGFALVFNGFGSLALTWAFVAFGLFYGFFGVLKLAVYLDIFLILGALALLALRLTGR
jgi:hypothetical protein